MCIRIKKNDFCCQENFLKEIKVTHMSQIDSALIELTKYLI